MQIPDQGILALMRLRTSFFLRVLLFFKFFNSQSSTAGIESIAQAPCIHWLFDFHKCLRELLIRPFVLLFVLSSVVKCLIYGEYLAAFPNEYPSVDQKQTELYFGARSQDLEVVQLECVEIFSKYLPQGVIRKVFLLVHVHLRQHIFFYLVL